MKAVVAGLVGLVLLTGSAYAQHQHGDGYASMMARPIKALSNEQVPQLSEGRGMGLSLPAELNSYPGPLHALEMADALNLTPDQHHRLLSIKEDMGAKAIALGHQIIAAETQLDQVFASGKADEADVTRQLAEIGRVNGELRTIHILAHIKTKALLTSDQVVAYDTGRGYRPMEDQQHRSNHRKKH